MARRFNVYTHLAGNSATRSFRWQYRQEAPARKRADELTGYGVIGTVRDEAGELVYTGTDLRQCPDCGVWTSNADHRCVEYDPGHPCPVCGAPSVFVFVAAPGTGQGWECSNGHRDFESRELTPAEVI